MTKPKGPNEPRLKARPGEGAVKKRVRGVDRPTEVAEARSRGRDTGTNAAAALVDENKPLTEMQKAFVKNWAAGDTILASSIRAGYADGGTYAYRMARMPNILRLYNEEKRAYEAASNMSRKRVMEGLIEGIEMAKSMSEPASVIAGWREVGKMCGYYAPVEVKHKVTHEGTVMIDRMNRMSDVDLLKFIQEQATQIQAGQAPQLTHDEDVTDVESRDPV
jgi:phage terminase small subunit